MRLLYITNAFPYPLTSGYLRHFHLLRSLAPQHEIELLSLTGAGHTEDHREAVEALGVVCTTFPRGPKTARRMGKLAPGVALGGLRALGRAAAERVAQGQVDVTVFSGKQTVGALGSIAGSPLLVDLCDATSSRLAGEAKAAHGWARVERRVEARSTRWAEQALVRRAGHTLVASERDRDLLALPAERCTVVPNGVDTLYWHRTEPSLGRRTVVFTGKLDYPANEDAALRLVSDVLPALRARVADVRVLIVGIAPTARLLDAARRHGATVTGEVPDVRPYLTQASVFAAPLRFGAGIQNKVLEALACEVPVVCSGLAAGGLCVDGATPPVTIADDTPAMVSALADALDAADRGATPRAEGRRYVAEHFSWERSANLVAACAARLLPTAPVDRAPMVEPGRRA